MRAKAKILDKIKDKDFIREGKEQGWIDKNNFIQGWYVDGYIVGPVIDVENDHIELEYWCKIDKNTLEFIDDKLEEALKQKVFTCLYSRLNKFCYDKIEKTDTYYFDIENNKGVLDNKDLKITFEIEPCIREEPGPDELWNGPFCKNIYSLENVKVKKKNKNARVEKLVELLESENKKSLSSFSTFSSSYGDEFIGNYIRLQNLISLFLEKNKDIINAVGNKRLFYKLIDLRNKHWRFEFVKEYENFNIFIGPGMGNGFLKLSFPPDSEYCITTVNLRKDVERGGSPLTYAQLLYNIGVVLEYLINEYDSLEEDIKKW